MLIVVMMGKWSDDSVSCVLSSAGDLLEMSVVRGVGGVCGMCLARGGV